MDFFTGVYENKIASEKKLHETSRHFRLIKKYGEFLVFIYFALDYGIFFK